MALGLQVPPRSGNYQLDVIKRTHVDIGSAAWWKLQNGFRITSSASKWKLLVRRNKWNARRHWVGFHEWKIEN